MIGVAGQSPAQAMSTAMAWPPKGFPKGLLVSAMALKLMALLLALPNTT
jgi:hypothetical protein